VTRLRDLGIDIGRFAPGEKNAITDVVGVGVGHVGVEGDGLFTGITAVLPYPVQTEKRRLFVGRWSLDGGEGMTGLGVAEDFGTLSSPILLTPSPAVGRVYDGLIQHGLQRDSGLSTVAGWPPLVVGVDPGVWNSARQVYATMGEAELTRALETATGGAVEEGNVGIGRGLSSFGMKGGVGSASRLIGDRQLGVLVAVGGGQRGELRVDGCPIAQWLDIDLPRGEEGGSFAAVVATDAPLLPHQLDNLAGRMALGLSRVGLLDATTREGVILAFSTATIESPAEGSALEKTRMVGEELERELHAGAAEAAEEAVLNGLLAAASVDGREPVFETLPSEGWPAEVRCFQQERGE
jgi:D-aminopeptidase